MTIVKEGTTFKIGNQTYIITYFRASTDTHKFTIDLNSVEYDKNKDNNKIGYSKVNKDGTIDKGGYTSYPKTLRKYFKPELITDPNTE